MKKREDSLPISEIKKWNITAEPTDFKCLMIKVNKYLYASKFSNLNKKDKFFEKYK